MPRVVTAGDDRPLDTLEATMADYWNHNTAFHPELLARVPSRDAVVLDVGCGDGLLLQRLAALSDHVVGVDPDAAAIARARGRLDGVSGVRVLNGDFLTSQELGDRQFDLITCVATMHHMPLAQVLERFRELLKPGGQLCVVGLSANKSLRDWILSGAQVVPIRFMSVLHRQSGYEGMTTARPEHALYEIRQVADDLLPGNRVRRRFYYRYTLTWTKPSSSAVKSLKPLE